MLSGLFIFLDLTFKIVLSTPPGAHFGALKQIRCFICLLLFPDVPCSGNKASYWGVLHETTRCPQPHPYFTSL